MIKIRKIKNISKLEFREELGDPFIIRMYHKDNYPVPENMGVKLEDLKGRNIGNDFDHEKDWKMYHGSRVPGFPSHPHRGFETITLVLDGYVDHFDSNGASGRYGPKDVQWMTAGSGMQHSEMFPLLKDGERNKLELFQIWLNLPKKDKFVDPYYKMLWGKDIPQYIETTDNNKAYVDIIAGQYKGLKALSPNPNSWANDKKNNVTILNIKLEKNSTITLPKVSNSLNRNLYFYKGNSDIIIEDKNIAPSTSLKLCGNSEIEIKNTDSDNYILVLEGEPINEPVVNRGPFVMNTDEEIEKAYRYFKETQFGGWPWSMRDPVNNKEDDIFAKYK